MSKPYRIRVQDVVTAEDFSTFQIDTLPLVTQQEFAELLEEVMQEAGWSPNEEGRMALEVAEDERCTFDPETMQIKTHVQGHEQVDQEFEGLNQRQANQRADKHMEEREQALGGALIERLQENQEERRAMFEGLVIDATGRAIKEAAQRLGDVQDIHETTSEDGTYQLTISIQERD